jgi:hypothetical protein
MRSPGWILLLYIVCFVPVARAETLQVVKDTEAAKFVGKNVEVRGQVASIYIAKHGDAYLFFGAAYPNQTFTGYIPAGWTFSGGPWMQKLQGQIIGVTGTVEIYRGKPEIKILSMDQIKQTDTRPNPQKSREAGLRLPACLQSLESTVAPGRVCLAFRRELVRHLPGSCMK